MVPLLVKNPNLRTNFPDVWTKNPNLRTKKSGTPDFTTLFIEEKQIVTRPLIIYN